LNYITTQSPHATPNMKTEMLVKNIQQNQIHPFVLVYKLFTQVLVNYT